jgi:predicted nuclease of restriction endonuclease-like (RecB) superfamily
MSGTEMKSEAIAFRNQYRAWVTDLKHRIRKVQLRAALAVNRELLLLYWGIGRDILRRQCDEGWGAGIVDRLAIDLSKAFPDVTGFSARNLKYMRAFAEAWPDEPIVQAVLAQITWYHNIALIEKLKMPEERLWYARQAVENGWSRNVLVQQMETGLYQRQGRVLTNSKRTLPASQSDLALQIVKDPYNFDFLGLAKDMKERDLERALITQVRDMILELGKGFAFVGSQYPLTVGGQEYRLDLLFYHVRLKCFVVIELKMGEFRPEFSGKMNFYLSAMDDLLRSKQDRPSIGMILCSERNELVVEYAVRDLRNPVGVAKYQLTPAVPESLRGELPTQNELARDFSKIATATKRLEKAHNATEAGEARGRRPRTKVSRRR